VRRRELILALGGTLIAPCVPRAQQKAMPVIGYVSLGAPGPNESYVVAFRQGLSENGYVEGQNLAVEYRWQRATLTGWPLWPPTSSAARSI
jgi:putative tryptophan/tyrosine transport system substrate-binding protein